MKMSITSWILIVRYYGNKSAKHSIKLVVRQTHGSGYKNTEFIDFVFKAGLG